MEFVILILAMVAALIPATMIVFSWFVFPCFAYITLRSNGFSGPSPNFPWGNLSEMKALLLRRREVELDHVADSSSILSFHDIHSTAFPYFDRWQRLHGKVFVYWLGTEPFLYVADPEFLKKMSTGIQGRNWGKPNVFKHDRKPMFGNSLLMVEGEDWVWHRNIITPAFSLSNLKAMASSMEDLVTNMLNRWGALIDSGHREIDVEKEIISTAGEIIARTSFGVSNHKGKKVIEKLRDMQITLFKSIRHVGVPCGALLNPKEFLKSKMLGKEIDDLLHSIIIKRMKTWKAGQQDLLGLLMTESLGVDRQKRRILTNRELVDECKAFFFGGHETTALAVTWTLLLLALHPEWQDELRKEIQSVMGDGAEEKLDSTRLVGLKKMGWVMSEVLRLYPPAPNVQRQAKMDIPVGDLVIPDGTNMWIDVVSMHHDESIWGGDVHEFKPQRFTNDIYGGSNHKMGFLPFGFGGRMCIGKNLFNMEYKVVLTLILSKFSFTLSPKYCHSPSILLSLRPTHGLPLVFKRI